MFPVMERKQKYSLFYSLYWIFLPAFLTVSPNLSKVILAILTVDKLGVKTRQFDELNLTVGHNCLDLI